MAVEWLGVIQRRVAEFTDTMHIGRVEKEQALFLDRLEMFTREQAEYLRLEELAQKHREYLRTMYLQVLKFDKSVADYERFAAMKEMMIDEKCTHQNRLIAVRNKNVRMKMLIEQIKNGQLALMGKIFDSEINDEREIEETLFDEGPIAARKKLLSLEEEVVLDSRALPIREGAENPEIQRKMSARRSTLPSLENKYKVMMDYLNRINEYYANETALQKKIEMLEARGIALDREESGIYSASGDMSTPPLSKKTTILNALRDLQARKIMHAGEVDAVNEQIKKIGDTFYEFSNWYAGLEIKPKEFVKAYRETEKLFTQLRKKTIKRYEGVTSVAMLIQRFDSIPAV